MRRFALFALLLIACDGSSTPTDPDDLAALRAISDGPVWGRRAPDGRLTTIYGDFPVDDSGDVVGERQILRQLGPELGLDDPDSQTQIFGTIPFFAGGDLTIFWLLHDGVRVAGADIRVLRQGDRVRLVSARIPPRILLDVDPLVTGDDAVSGLFEQLGMAMSVPTSEPELRIWDSAMLEGTGGRPALAWEVDVRSVGTTYVSATSGRLLFAAAGPNHLTAQVSYARAATDYFSFTLPGASDLWFEYPGGAVTPPASDADRWDEAMRAYADAESIHGFFASRFGWDSYDGDDSQINVFVGQDVTCVQPSLCGQAGWMGLDKTGRERTDANSEYFIFQAGIYADDIFAHEYTHAILDHITRTDPHDWGPPGSVEESLGDTFAAFYDVDDRWTVGEGFGIARALNDPASNNLGVACPAQPAHVMDLYTPQMGGACDVSAPDCEPGNACVGGTCRSLDSKGFSHCNAGVPSLAAWRMTAGDPSVGIRAIGIAKAQAIYFAALQLVTEFESFEDLYIHLLASCHYFVESEFVPYDALGPMLPWDCGQLINSFFSVGIARAGDMDLDGWDDIADNCRTVANFDQLNSDGDDAGDACDLETDNAVYCYWESSSVADWCIQTNDPSLRDGVTVECEITPDGHRDGLCPPGGHTCWRITGPGTFSSIVSYDAATDDDRTRCTDADEIWMDPWAQPEG